MPEDPHAEVREELIDDLTESAPNGRLGSVLAEAPRWLIVAAGLAYSTGFLVVSAFLESFGIKDTSGEFLRLRYLTVGFYFLMFIGSLLVTAVSLIGARRRTIVEVIEDIGTGDILVTRVVSFWCCAGKCDRFLTF